MAMVSVVSWEPIQTGLWFKPIGLLQRFIHSLYYDIRRNAVYTRKQHNEVMTSIYRMNRVNSRNALSFMTAE